VEFSGAVLKKSGAVIWQVYIIRCCDGTLYTGITTDVERRMAEHAAGRGAKYFRGRQPKELVFLEDGHDRSSASKREAAIKRLSRREKERLLSEAGVPAAA
jgi:putative endonuclease